MPGAVTAADGQQSDRWEKEKRKGATSENLATYAGGVRL